MIITVKVEIKRVCCNVLTQMVESNEVRLIEGNNMAFVYKSCSTGEIMYVPYKYCPNCGEEIEIEPEIPTKRND